MTVCRLSADQISEYESREQGCGQSILGGDGGCTEKIEFVFDLNEAGGTRRSIHPLCSAHAQEAMKRGAVLMQSPA